MNPFRLLAYQFQFTHPGRGATQVHSVKELGEGVSIHAPREGCDEILPAPTLGALEFQFTHPGRGATSTWSNLLRSS